MLSYILVIRVLEDFRTAVGSLGEVNFKKGHYMYVGSARAGISRICRHFRKKKKLRWHIDYLTVSRFAKPVCAYLFDNEECYLSKMLSKKYTGVRGFGCSDCKCYTHLYYSPNVPVFEAKVVYPADCAESFRQQVLRD